MIIIIERMLMFVLLCISLSLNDVGYERAEIKSSLICCMQ